MRGVLSTNADLIKGSNINCQGHRKSDGNYIQTINGSTLIQI